MNAEAAIQPRDRLSFALFLVISLHATVIFGVGFVWHPKAASAPTIEVTLARHNDQHAPEHADFIAQANQIGSGSAEDLRETTAPRDADIHANDPQPVLSSPDLPPPPTDAAQTPVTTHAAHEQVHAAMQQEQRPDRHAVHPSDADFVLSSEIASLDARPNRELQTEARGPRVRRLTSVSTRSAPEAAYVNAWVQQVEQVGNLHYPEEARRRQLYGEVRLLVMIAPDGTLGDVTVLQSSGHTLLDDAAIRTVRLAAPFPPFPDEMRREFDLLELERVWQFRRNS